MGGGSEVRAYNLEGIFWDETRCVGAFKCKKLSAVVLRRLVDY